MNLDSILKSKTFWTGIAAIVSAGGMYATGEASMPQAVQIGINGALGIFLRMALAKVGA